MPHWTRRYAVPAFAASLTFFLVVAAAGVVVLVRHNSDPTDARRTPVGSGSAGIAGSDPANPVVDPPDATPETGDSRTRAGTIDDCVVGTWLAVSYTEYTSNAFGTGEMALIGDGYRYEFRADGTGAVDFGDATRMGGVVLDEEVEAVLAGRVAFDYTATGGTMRISNQDSDATVTTGVLGFPLSNELTLETDPFDYTCEDDTLTQSLPDRFSGEFSRQRS